ncbi:hypothetical protein HanIR_Chr05g0237571 [Helianthus annuus]|nr:hypothetical protein HanIR_Chr05g0237571 [Helianthus annuus]
MRENRFCLGELAVTRGKLSGSPATRLRVCFPAIFFTFITLCLRKFYHFFMFSPLKPIERILMINFK